MALVSDTKMSTDRVWWSSGYMTDVVTFKCTAFLASEDLFLYHKQSTPAKGKGTFGKRICTSTSRMCTFDKKREGVTLSWEDAPLLQDVVSLSSEGIPYHCQKTVLIHALTQITRPRASPNSNHQNISTYLQIYGTIGLWIECQFCLHFHFPHLSRGNHESSTITFLLACYYQFMNYYIHDLHQSALPSAVRGNAWVHGLCVIWSK